MKKKKNMPTIQETASDAGAASSIPRSERSLGEGNSNLLQYSCLGNPIARRGLQSTGL